MPTSINLSRDELIDITGKFRPSAQYRVLIQMGIPVKKRPDGVPIVCRQTYLQTMGDVTVTKPSDFDKPNFSSFQM